MKEAWAEVSGEKKRETRLFENFRRGIEFEATAREKLAFESGIQFLSATSDFGEISIFVQGQG